MSTKNWWLAYGDNVLIEQIEVNGNTVKGKIIHSNDDSLKHGDIVLYGYSEWNEVYLDNYNGDAVVDVIWRPKVRCILREVEDE